MGRRMRMEWQTSSLALTKSASVLLLKLGAPMILLLGTQQI